jgi:hypothetical protein
VKPLVVTQIYEEREVTRANTENERGWCVRPVTCDHFGKKYGFIGDCPCRETKVGAYKAMLEWVEARFGEGEATGTDIWHKAIVESGRYTTYLMLLRNVCGNVSHSSQCRRSLRMVRESMFGSVLSRLHLLLELHKSTLLYVCI